MRSIALSAMIPNHEHIMKGGNTTMYEQATRAVNRASPSNEDEYIRVYERMFPNSLKPDGYDVAAVISMDGIRGHALMKESDNRSHDFKPHPVFNFISDDELERYM